MKEIKDLGIFAGRGRGNGSENFEGRGRDNGRHEISNGFENGREIQEEVVREQVKRRRTYSPKKKPLTLIQQNKALMHVGKRKCKECGEIKSLEWFSKKAKDRWKTVCKTCSSINSENRILFTKNLKRCKGCGQIKKLDDFGIKSMKKGRKDYRQTYCKICKPNMNK